MRFSGYGNSQCPPPHSREAGTVDRLLPEKCIRRRSEVARHVGIRLAIYNLNIALGLSIGYPSLNSWPSPATSSAGGNRGDSLFLNLQKNERQTVLLAQAQPARPHLFGGAGRYRWRRPLGHRGQHYLSKIRKDRSSGLSMEAERLRGDVRNPLEFLVRELQMFHR
jgi:hypothetical protein